MTATVDWSAWSVVLLKPDCVARGLAAQVLSWVALEAEVIDHRTVTATQEQIFAHYEDLLTVRRAHFTWVDVAADLRRTYVGQRVGIALAYGPDVARRLRQLIGHFDPAQADPDSIRGRFGTDSLDRAQAEQRLIRNVIHTSDDPAGARREFGIWCGAADAHLLHATATSAEGARP
jgi:nucleoside-diphosphate kinase